MGKMKFNFEATGIGSLPFKDAKTACQLVFDNFKHIPFWPQLPKRSYLEQMYCQFSESIPGLNLDENGKTLYIDTKKALPDIEKVYQRYLDNDLEYFKISPRYAEGLYEFCGSFAKSGRRIDFVKGHITGPVSFALSITDENKKAIIYDKDMFEVITKVLSMKAKWQIGKLKALDPNVIIFIDEPYLVLIGSSFVNIPREDTIKSLDEINKAIKSEGALSGIHCCGNTDWPLLLKRGIDIINFDAYNFTKEFLLYSADIKEFLKSGGTIAWGIVPSSEAIDKESSAAIAKKLKDGLKLLIDRGIDKDSISSIVTPSCGLGTIDEQRAKRILELTSEIARIISA